MIADKDYSAGSSDPRAIPALLGDILSQFAGLFQSEADLAKAELGEQAREIGRALGFLAGAAAFVVPALVMALFALSAALVASGWSQPVSYLTSAILALVIAAILFAIGAGQLSAHNLARRTARQFEKDKDLIRGMAR